MRLTHPLSVESALARKEVTLPEETRKEVKPLTADQRTANYQAQGGRALTPAQSRRARHKYRHNASE